jgi:hypothetical protein
MVTTRRFQFAGNDYDDAQTNGRGWGVLRKLGLVQRLIEES